VTPLEAYQALEAQERRMHALRGALAMLGWDRAVMMPPGSSETRAEQMAGLGLILHEMNTNSSRVDLLETAKQGVSLLNDWQSANLHEIERGYVRATALPPDLVERKARLSARTEMAWRSAKADGDYDAIVPLFRDLLAIVREEAARFGNALSLDPYDALLDQYEPELRLDQVEALFAPLEADLPGLLDRVIDIQGQQGAAIPLEGPFAIADQEKLSRNIMADLGFDFDHGRLDVSHHPFTGGVPGDIRLTTRYEDTDFIQALMATIHETGHALYESGLPEDWRQQPVGAARGMVLHESQSLLFEMQAGRDPAFIGCLAACSRDVFGGDGPPWEAENLRKHYHHVSRGLIRVYADEVSYPLHVILRTRLERRMIAGDLRVEDLPEAWNAEMKAGLGIVPDNHSDGCLQDIHWYAGAFGYFPTYTLGAIAAAQIFEAATKANPEIRRNLATGDVADLLAWLRKRIHGQASRQSTDQIIRAATGQGLDTAPFLNHLRRRYLD